MTALPTGTENNEHSYCQRDDVLIIGGSAFRVMPNELLDAVNGNMAACVFRRHGFSKKIIVAYEYAMLAIWEANADSCQLKKLQKVSIITLPKFVYPLTQ